MLNELTEIFETQKGSRTSRAQAIKEGMLIDVSGEMVLLPSQQVLCSDYKVIGDAYRWIVGEF